MFTIPNIYTNKNMKFYIAIPVILMIIGAILATHITLDTSLSGGVSVILQTNATISAPQVSSQLGSALSVANPTVFTSPGQVQITIANNQSLVNAENYQLNFYSYLSNYTAFNFNATTLQNALRTNPANQTLLSQLAVANSGINSSLSGMTSQLNLELASLKP
ncbi:MAG: hypothetical protein KGH53_04010, partial [Candidatus Micrarchaeota archaeon]|nr:hypothetical protein [Candidatus Micrarchaeota archaeon]